MSNVCTTAGRDERLATGCGKPRCQAAIHRAASRPISNVEQHLRPSIEDRGGLEEQKTEAQKRGHSHLPSVVEPLRHLSWLSDVPQHNAASGQWIHHFDIVSEFFQQTNMIVHKDAARHVLWDGIEQRNHENMDG